MSKIPLNLLYAVDQATGWITVVQSLSAMIVPLNGAPLYYLLTAQSSSNFSTTITVKCAGRSGSEHAAREICKHTFHNTDPS